MILSYTLILYPCRSFNTATDNVTN